jgi:hypothetical protein
MGEARNIYRILLAEPEGRDHLIDLDVDGITLNWVFKQNRMGGFRPDSSGWFSKTR